MSVDENLLARNDGDNSSSDSKNSGGDETKADNELGVGEPKSLREARMMERAKAEKERKGAGKDGKGSGITAGEKPSAIALSLASLLKSSWLNVFPSFGLSILWIDVHVILGKIFGNKVFCELGDEWTLGKETMGGSLSGVKKNKMIKTVEPMGLALGNLLLVLMIVAIISLIALIAGFVDSPMKAIKAMLESVFTNWSSIK
ncbi:hypothetical protein JXK06_00130 [Patescibacteria group bacterium]|nr:hypothetical protein [Patescibacteria group bacterium]